MEATDVMFIKNDAVMYKSYAYCFGNSEGKILALERQLYDEERAVLMLEIQFSTFSDDEDGVKKQLELFLGAFIRTDKMSAIKTSFVRGRIKAICVIICGVPVIITPWDRADLLFLKWKNLHSMICHN